LWAKNQSHWFLYSLDLSKLSITIFDSISHDKDYYSESNNSIIAFFEEKHRLQFEKKINKGKMDKQPDGYSCGYRVLSKLDQCVFRKESETISVDEVKKRLLRFIEAD
jgi:Ulp1 family protease